MSQQWLTRVLETVSASSSTLGTVFVQTSMPTCLDPVSTISSLSFTDKVISRSLQSCITKAHTINSSTRAYFIRYASFAIELLESRLDATDQSWFPLLSKYDQEVGGRAKAHEDLRRASKLARDSLREAKYSEAASPGDNVSKALAALWSELEPVLTAETALLSKIEPRVSQEDTEKLEEEFKKRRLGMMKKDGHLWCATYLMRSLTAEEREHFPPGVPSMAKSVMLMTGNWQFSRLVVIAAYDFCGHPLIFPRREFQFAPQV